MHQIGNQRKGHRMTGQGFHTVRKQREFSPRVFMLGLMLTMGACTPGMFTPGGDVGENQGANYVAAPSVRNSRGTDYAESSPAFSSGSIGQTAVGKRAENLRNQLDSLQSDSNGVVATLNDLQRNSQNLASTYFSAVGEVNSRLQVGTTPGNPHVMQKWEEASAALDQFSDIGKQMSQLSNRLSGHATQAAYLLDETRATFGLSGAVDEDHAALRRLEDDLQKTEMQISRARSELVQQIERHNDYVAGERRNLETLSLAVAKGEFYGQNLGNLRPFAAERSLPSVPISSDGNRINSVPPASTGVFRAPSKFAAPVIHYAAAETAPFVVVRFMRPNVDYGQPFYQAMQQALSKKPDANFEVRAVPGRDGDINAYQKAVEVVSSMAEMGVPRERIKIVKAKKSVAGAPEVQVFLR